jgi:hypothetical protein
MTSWRVSRDFVCEFLTQDTSPYMGMGCGVRLERGGFEAMRTPMKKS